MAKEGAKLNAARIRYANNIVGRHDLEEVLAKDSLYQATVKIAEEAKQRQREVVKQREAITHEHTLALPEEREASRLERALKFARQRVGELKKQRDRQRVIANSARVDANRRMRRMVSANNIAMRKCQAEFRRRSIKRMCTRTQYSRRCTPRTIEKFWRNPECYGEVDEEEELTDESIGLVPPPEEEEQDGRGLQEDN